MRKIFFVVLLGVPFLQQAFAQVQRDSASGTLAAVSHSSEHPGIENLNLLGAVTHMPPFSDTVLGADSVSRRELYSKGFAVRSNATLSYMQNTLDSPVAADQQVYQGQRGFGKLMLNPILTYDMRDFHLRNAQLYLASGLNWVSWNAAGPSSITLSSMYLYKAFANGHIEAKAGYVSNDFEFIGLQVGGSLSTGSQGVYAVLPYEVGLSRFPLTAPSFNLNLIGPKHLYFKTAAQRSLDAGGGAATIGRNAAGFRFMPKGDKLLNVYEVGFNKRATAGSGQTWMRAGYIHNTTKYPNSRTGVPTSGNMCAYILADRQLYQSDAGQPNHGIYAGVSAIGTSTSLNAYTRYYELRVYDQGPFKSRPGDTASLVASYSTYNPYLLASLQAQGKSFWRNGSTVTGSYNIHFARGTYLSTGLSYRAGPAITPRVANALIFSTIMNIFF
jgi:porin